MTQGTTVAKWVVVLAVLFSLIGCRPSQRQANADLMAACKTNNVAAAIKALDQGADVNATDAHGLTPLSFTAANPDPKLTVMLLSRGASPNIAMKKLGWTPVHFAAGYGCYKTLVALCSFGGKTDVADCYGQTPLHLAVFSYSHEMVRALCVLQSSIDAKDIRGRTPLWCACALDYPDTRIVSYLLRAGANPRATTTDGVSCEQVARKHGNPGAASMVRRAR